MEQGFTFEFTLDEVNLLLQGLGELPAKDSIGMIGRINQEVQQEMQKRQQPPEAED